MIGQYLPDSDKVAAVFAPTVPLDNDFTRFIQELVELVYGIRPSTSMQSVGDGIGIIVGDAPKQFIVTPAKDSGNNNLVGAVISPRY